MGVGRGVLLSLREELGYAQGIFCFRFLYIFLLNSHVLHLGRGADWTWKET